MDTAAGACPMGSGTGDRFPSGPLSRAFSDMTVTGTAGHAARIVLLGISVATALVLGMSAAGCGSSTAAENSSTTSSKQPAAKPGDLVKAERVDKPTMTPPSSIWRITYHSQGRTGHDTVVSGFAIVPDSPAPQGGRPVYAWAHGTTGLGDQCAPSRNIKDNLAPYGYEPLRSGAVIVQSDYESLGTPGDHTYLDGVSEGHATLDSVRAASHLQGVGPTAGVVIAGQSQGGGAALWAAQQAHTYAPELDLRGVLAIAPAAELPTVADALPASPYRGLLLLAASGLHASYGAKFDPAQFLTAAANADLTKVAGECVDATVGRYQTAPADSILSKNPNDVAAIHRILQENSPGATAPTVPILLAQGALDQQIPIAVTAQLEQKYCQLGATVIRQVAPAADHDGVIDAVRDQAVQWTTDRYARKPAPTDCTTTNQPTTTSSNR
jgi:dienelactone hydrolase